MNNVVQLETKGNAVKCYKTPVNYNYSFIDDDYYEVTEEDFFNDFHFLEFENDENIESLLKKIDENKKK